LIHHGVEITGQEIAVGIRIGIRVDVGVPVPGRPALATHNANSKNQSGKGNLIKTYKK
jgi:hypothetical protein